MIDLKNIDNIYIAPGYTDMRKALIHAVPQFNTKCISIPFLKVSSCSAIKRRTLVLFLDVVPQEADADPVTQAEGKTIYANGKTGVGSDSNPGTEAEPVSSLKKAVELAGENGTVIILDTVYIREPTVLDNNVTIKRGGKCDVGMIYLGQSSLTINNATIDGNKEKYPTTAQLIAIYGAPTLTINEGAKIVIKVDILFNK